jgi:hypothetical protein
VGKTALYRKAYSERASADLWRTPIRIPDSFGHQVLENKNKTVPDSVSIQTSQLESHEACMIDYAGRRRNECGGCLREKSFTKVRIQVTCQ